MMPGLDHPNKAHWSGPIRHRQVLTMRQAK